MTDKGKILIADDEETFLFSTADLLRKEGYACDCVFNAKEAADWLNKEEYDLLISDIKMPGNSELDLVKDLPQKAKGMPVILVTGYPSVHSAVKSIQLPVVAYMIKPLDFNELLKHIRCAIEHFQIYNNVCDSQRRLNNWCNDLDNIGKLMSNEANKTSDEGIEWYFAIILNNIVNGLKDLKNLTEILISNGQRQNLNEIPAISEYNIMVDAISDTIAVLEKTKRSFKSKELGQLRLKLKQVIDDSSQINLRNSK